MQKTIAPEYLQPTWWDAIPVHFEWYKPTGEEYEKLSPEMKEYVDKGGLDMRPVATEGTKP